MPSRRSRIPGLAKKGASASVGALSNYPTQLAGFVVGCLPSSGSTSFPSLSEEYFHISLTVLCHGPTTFQMAVEGSEMIENGEPAATVAASSTATVTPSCYRVSVLSGSLEVSARLKTTDDLELLMRVLEANKVLFTKTHRLEPEISAETHQSATNLLAGQSGKAKAAQRTKTSTKANGSALKFLTKVEEPEILTLT